MRVNIIRGGSRIPDVLNVESFLPPHNSVFPPQEGSGACLEAPASICLPGLPGASQAPLHCLLCCSPPLPTTRALLEGNSGEGRQAHRVLGPGTDDLSNSAPL